MPLYSYKLGQDADNKHSSDDVPIEGRLCHALENDNKSDFVQLINSLPCVEDELLNIENDMLFYDSANCAAAILAGETKNLNITAVLGSNPLHEAVDSNSPGVTAALLEYGFSADTRCDYASRNLRDVLPMGVSLSKLRFHLARCKLKVRTSAVNLIIDLFRQPLYRFETLRLVAENSKELENEFFNYLKEGGMVEVGALLLVARSRLLSSSTAKGESCGISQMYDFLFDAKRRVSAGTRLIEKDKLNLMEETLILLQIFDKIGDKLAALLRLNFGQNRLTFCRSLAAASLIEDAGFDLKADYLYRDNCISRYRAEAFRSYVLERGVNDCGKTAFTTDPSYYQRINHVSCRQLSTFPDIKGPRVHDVRRVVKEIPTYVLVSTDASLRPTKDKDQNTIEAEVDGKKDILHNLSFSCVIRDLRSGSLLTWGTGFLEAGILGNNSSLGEAMTIPAALDVAWKCGYGGSKILFWNDSQDALSWIEREIEDVPKHATSTYEDLKSILPFFSPPIEFGYANDIINKSVHTLAKFEHEHRTSLITGFKKEVRREKKHFVPLFFPNLK